MVNVALVKHGAVSSGTVPSSRRCRILKLSNDSRPVCGNICEEELLTRLETLTRNSFYRHHKCFIPPNQFFFSNLADTLTNLFFFFKKTTTLFSK